MTCCWLFVLRETWFRAKFKSKCISANVKTKESSEIQQNQIEEPKTTPGVDNFLSTATAETRMLFSNYRSKNKFLVFIPSYNNIELVMS